MYIGEVVGCVVASVKEERLENIPLLVVQLIEKGVKTKMIVAADATRQAGRGDFVFAIGWAPGAHVPQDGACGRLGDRRFYRLRTMSELKNNLEE